MLTNQIAFLEEGEPFQAPLSCFSQHRYKEERNSTTSYNFSKQKHLKREKSCGLKISAKDSRREDHMVLAPLPLHYCLQEKITPQETNFEIHTKHESRGLPESCSLAALAVVIPQNGGRALHILGDSWDA